MLHMKVRFSAENSVHSILFKWGKTLHITERWQEIWHVAFFPVNMNAVHYFITVSGLPPPHTLYTTIYINTRLSQEGRMRYTVPNLYEAANTPNSKMRVLHSSQWQTHYWSLKAVLILQFYLWDGCEPGRSRCRPDSSSHSAATGGSDWSAAPSGKKITNKIPTSRIFPSCKCEIKTKSRKFFRAMDGQEAG